MEIKHLLKRVAIDLGIALAVVLLVGGSIVGYVWVKGGQQRAEARKQVDEYITQNKALESLGDVQLDITELTLGGLEQRLHPHSMQRPSGKNNARLGWACNREDCLIWAIFAVSPTEQIPADATPAAIIISNPWGSLFGSSQRMSVDGARLGDSTEQLLESGRKRGYGVETGHNRITWDKDWSLVYGADAKGKVCFLYLLNEPILTNAAAEERTLAPRKR